MSRGARLAAAGALVALACADPASPPETAPPAPIALAASVAPPVEIAPPEPPPENGQPAPARPRRKVLLPNGRVTPAVARAARELLGRPMGSETVREFGDRSYAFVVEPHYHAPESGKTPVGWHKGVTVYALEDE